MTHIPHVLKVLGGDVVSPSRGHGIFGPVVSPAPPKIPNRFYCNVIWIEHKSTTKSWLKGENCPIVYKFSHRVHDFQVPTWDNASKLVHEGKKTDLQLMSKLLSHY